MKDSTTAGGVDRGAITDSEGTKRWNSGCSANDHAVVRRVLMQITRRVLIKITMFSLGFAVLWMFLYNYVSPFGLPVSPYDLKPSSLEGICQPELEHVLKNASMKDKTVIITTLNDAWAEPGSIFDLFLESFRIGNQTEKLLNHLVVITWDQKAYSRCIDVHPYCYQVETQSDNFTNEASFMTPSYLHMMWRRIEFLTIVLEMGYSFAFTDTDIMWLRNPFLQFYVDADFQIACDFFNGKSTDLKNLPNGGFTYVKSNNQTIWFYKYWFNSRMAYPHLHDQDVLNKIKFHRFISKIKLKIRFLSTAYFGGFCQASKDFNKVCTMHANCCVGLDNKVNDLKILLEDWRKYMALPTNEKEHAHPSWSVPQSCRKFQNQ